ncbi:MAG TPA: PD-(D/E)XK nuclease family protein [Gammaproteobacteria bacterium]
MNKESGQLLDQGYCLLTPTTRLSRALQHQYALEQAEQGRLAWQTPDILPWQGWLQRCWKEFVFTRQLDRVLLSTPQQLYLWSDIINRSSYARRLLNRSQTARLAMQAWQLCHEWLIPVFPERVYVHDDAHAFRLWSEEYRKICEQRDWVDQAGLATLLSTQSEFIPGPEKLALVGFDQLTPQQRQLLQRLADQGCEIREVSLEQSNIEPRAFAFRDNRTELYTAASWARTRLEENPGQRIGIVVNNLASLAHEIKNVFEDVLHPGAILDNASMQSYCFSVSLGRPLSAFPMIVQALQLLSLGRRSLELEEFSRLLRSPFIKASMQEGQCRAKFDAAIRKSCEAYVSRQQLQTLIERGKLSPDIVPAIFMETYLACGRLFANTDSRQSPSRWVQFFTQILELFAWPGERTLNSDEYQTLLEWQATLDNLARLDLVTKDMTYQDALGQLRSLLASERFQPETREASIQILGTNGAAGMQFDHLWIMNLHDNAWPSQEEPNAFIPIALQRDAGLPAASPGNLLVHASMLLKRLISSSPEVVLSYPEMEKDQVYQPSALIRQYLSGTSPDIPVFKSYANHLLGSKSIETFPDDQTRAIPEGVRVSGGTALFKDQAACPFRAFARHRLAAEGLKSPDIGLDALERGSIAHAVVEQFWGETGSLENLLQLTATQLEQVVDAVVKRTVKRYQQQLPFTFTDRFTDIECNRLKLLLVELAELEKKRQAFTVSECELKHTFVINDIEINTRIDRIDQLKDGRLVVIDYKTGSIVPNASAWLGERPDEPQLPLYAINSEGDVAAVAFVKLRRGEVKFSGLSDGEDVLPGIKSINASKLARESVKDWPDLLIQWQTMLDSLASDFRHGIARVDPKDKTTCTWCDLHSFCRIYEKQKDLITDGEKE